jgi:uncharacterized phage-associated protein
MVGAQDVARALREHQHIPRVRLQKLLYYCQGWHLALFGQPLFDDTIEAWDNGPVVASVWRAEEHHIPLPPPADLPDSGRYVIDFVLGRYGAMNGPDMINQTHDEMPWRLAREQGRNAPLAHDTMREYFSKEPETEETLRVLRAIEANPETTAWIEDVLEADQRAGLRHPDTREAIEAYRRQLSHS